jgi:cobalt/nickel transport system permease protein
MHIPDGYLSVSTCAAAWAVALPLWAVGLRRIREKLDETTLPLIASLTALSFVVMMFNIPIPGGTSGHAVGMALIAILFGPWTAFISISLVLLVQALVFGDGGILTFAANALSMGFVGSFAGYALFTALKRYRFAPFVAGWGALVAASAVTALFLGIQPLIAAGPEGQPLFFPFGLSVTIPALVGSHVLFFGLVEGLFTQLAYHFVRRHEPSAAERVA